MVRAEWELTGWKIFVITYRVIEFFNFKFDVKLANLSPY